MTKSMEPEPLWKS